MSFADDAGLFPHQLDVDGDRVLVVQMTEADYRSASFLDNRLLSQTFPMQWFEWNQLESMSIEAPSPAKWIFHIGHVGSTLISRLLGEVDGVLSLREPQALRQLAELKQLDGLTHSPWKPGTYVERQEVIVRWLSRSFRPSQQALVKASSFASEIAGDVASSGSDAIFLFLKPERYIQSILGGENSRQELAALAGARLQRLNRRLAGEPIKLWELNEAQRAAMAWTCEMATLTEANASADRWFDFDMFLASPTEDLRAMADRLGIALSEDAAGPLVSGPIMSRYSKAPEHGYSSDLRERVLQQAAEQHSDEIAGALRWLENLARRERIVAEGLDRSTR